LVLVANAEADRTANGQNLGVEERHDERVIASDNELLASLIRRKHSIMIMYNCVWSRDRKSGGEALLTTVARLGMSGRAEGGEQPRIATLAIKFCSEKSHGGACDLLIGL
jgi:hypothetical protein